MAPSSATATISPPASPNQFGTTTNAVSADGRKVFFESPPPDVSFPFTYPQPHLYMRDLVAGTTTPLYDPSSTGFARYEGASKDGSLVFFRSNEGLGGSATDLELYAFNTTAQPIGVIPALTAVPVSDGPGGTLDGHLLGISAISNDGSHVYFVAEAVLTTAPNGRGQTAQANELNFYMLRHRHRHHRLHRHPRPGRHHPRILQPRPADQRARSRAPGGADPGRQRDGVRKQVLRRSCIVVAIACMT